MATKYIVNNVSGQTINGQQLQPYKVYTALLTRTGANAPSVVTELENTLGAIEYTYATTGIYNITSANLFTTNRTAIFIQPQGNGISANTLNASINSASNISLVQATDLGTNDNDWTWPVSIEIRVYN